MPRAPAPPTRTQLAADALIAGAPLATVPELRAAIRRIKQLYYEPLGRDRRAALRRRLEAHYAALIAMVLGRDPQLARAARRALPPSLVPKSARPARPARRRRAR